MGLIEQAAQRLEQLRQVGVTAPPPPEAAPVATTTSPPSVPATPPPAVDAVQAPPAEPAPIGFPETTLSRRVELSPHALAKAGFIRLDSPRSQLADEFRVIKRPLIANAMGKGKAAVREGNLIMVTSALPGEGKTFTAANLAMSIAMELDNTVMLVDADVARPTLLSKFGLPPSPGLLDVLLDDSIDLSRVLLRTNVEKLTILPSGTPHSRATELLASEAMVRLLEDMSTRYADRIIIFDSPPLLVTTEARALASHMGQVVVVVRAESTTQPDVKHALSTLENCPVVLMMLNQAVASTADGYGYGYGYGYGN